VLIVIFLGVAIAVGTLLFLSAKNAAPGHVSPVAVPREERETWTRPEEGRLGGTVKGQDSAGVVLEGFDGRVWYVAASAATPGFGNVEFMGLIRVIGEETAPGAFTAKEIMAWGE
jgi:hypothetical protein